MWLRISLGILFLLGGVSFWAWYDYQRSLSEIAVQQQEVIMEIAKGDSFNRTVDELIEHNIAITPHWFKLLAYRRKALNGLKAGEYQLDHGMTAPEILALFVSGSVKQYAITFPEGWRFTEIMRKIRQTPKVAQTLQGLSDDEIMKKLGAMEKRPEGLFFPDTYYFEKNMTDLSLLRRAYRKMKRILGAEWENRASDLPLQEPYQALILASIVEKETALVTERADIAGVFIRRLQRGMLLQSDPTIIYGMGEAYDGDIRSRDISARTDYNTYVIKGLPPTPIAMPGQQAIHAVLHPATGKSLYFVACGDGSHIFSETLVDHNRAVDRYQRNKDE